MFFYNKWLVSGFEKNDDSKVYVDFNKYDTYSKVIKCIESCNNFRQLECCRKMIRSFGTIFKDKALSRGLKDELSLKEDLLF